MQPPSPARTIEDKCEAEQYGFLHTHKIMQSRRPVPCTAGHLGSRRPRRIAPGATGNAAPGAAAAGAPQGRKGRRLPRPYQALIITTVTLRMKVCAEFPNIAYFPPRCLVRLCIL